MSLVFVFVSVWLIENVYCSFKFLLLTWIEKLEHHCFDDEGLAP